ncbi:hypothetical protein Taro_044591, partial [Colocasia esculenta]|nr:hypothetical protein [Colocasia esculenta]
HSLPPNCVRVNDTLIRSLFLILDPQVACSNPLHLGFFKISGLSAKPKPRIRLGFRQFPHVTLTHPVVSEVNDTPIGSLFLILDHRVACSDPFHLDSFKISGLSVEPKPGIRLGFHQFPYDTLTHPVVLE